MGLAEFLQERRAPILSEWEKQARQRFPLRKDDRPALLEQLPRILDRLIDAAQSVARGQSLIQSDDLLFDATLDRLPEDFEVLDVAAELSMLRDVVLDRLAEGNLPLPAREWMRLSQTLDHAILRATNRSVEARERTLDALDRFTAGTVGLVRLEDYLEGLLKALREAAPGVDFVAVVLLREDNILQGRAEVGLGAKSWLERTRQVGEGFTGRVAAEKRPIEIRASDQLPPAERSALMSTRARALYGVPLFHADRLIGVASIGARKADGFSREEKLLFRALANRVSALLVEARLQEQRRQTEELLRAVLDAAPTLIQVKDASGRYLQINGVWSKVIGTSGMVGRTPFEIFPRDAAERLLENDRQVLAAGKPMEFEETIIAPDGEQLTFLTWKFPLHDAEGHPYAVAGISTDITARKRAEAEKASLLARERLARAQAEEARNLLDTFLSSARVGFSLVDQELRFRFVNKALAAENARPVEEHLGRTLREVNPTIAPDVEETLRTVLRTGKSVRKELSAARPTEPDRIRHWMTEHFPVRTVDGALFGVGSAVIDLTELRTAEAERERLLALLRAVLDQMPGGVVIAEAPSTDVLLVNRQNDLQTGLRSMLETDSVSVGEIVGRSLHLDGTPCPPEEEPLGLVLSHGKASASEELLVRDSEGALRRLAVNAVAVHDDAGQLIAGVRFAYDVTEQRAAEERNRFLSAATETLTSSLDYEKTLARLAELAVPQIADWCTIHSLEEGGVVRCLAIRHFDPRRTDVVREMLESQPLKLDGAGAILEVLRSGAARLVEDITDADLVALARNERHLQLLRQAGLRSALILPLVAHGATLGVLSLTMADSGRRFTPPDREFAHELVRRAALALDNSRLYREAQEAVRLREDFLSMASHDLRSPLNALQLRVQLLLRNIQSGQELSRGLVEDSLKTMQRQGARIQTLVETLFDVSRIQVGRLDLDLEDLDLAAVTREIVQRQGDLLRSAGCECSILTEPIQVRCDRIRLERVLTNLLSNAAKYGAGSPVEVSVRRTGSGAELRVSDRGVGIAPEELPKLFQRFSRVGDRSAFHGTGLGLWIARIMVNAMGGSIRVDEGAAQGASFVVTLPLRDTAVG